MTTIRSTRRSEASRANLPVVGYYLMTKCALTEEALPVDRTDDRAVECYHAISVERSREGPDSVTWRGDSDAPKGSWILLHGRASQTVLANMFHQELRDSTSYYLPGTWIEYSDGRVRYEWTARRADTVFVTVRGERISRDVLQAPPR